MTTVPQPEGMSPDAATPTRRLPHGFRVVAWTGIVLGHRRRVARIAADRDPLLVLEPCSLRDRGHARDRRGDPRRASLRGLRDRLRRDRIRRRLPRNAFERRQARVGRRLVGPVRGDAALRDPADLRCDRRHVLGALRRGEHRPRGHDADGRVLRHPRGGQDGLVDSRAADRGPLGRCGCPPLRILRDLAPRRPDSRRDGHQLPRARTDRVPLHRPLRARRHVVRRYPEHSRRPPDVPRRMSRSSVRSSRS